MIEFFHPSLGVVVDSQETLWEWIMLLYFIICLVIQMSEFPDK